MRKLLGIASALTVGAAMLIAPSLSTKVSAGGASTGQGIMVNLNTGGQLALVQTQTYRLDETAAAAYFTNSLTGGPAVSCNGSAANCAATNQPAAPAAPAADALQLNRHPDNKGLGGGVVFDNRCTFLDGGTLAGRQYTQAVTVNGLNGKGNWTFTWTYDVTPTQATVDPFTAWNLVGTTGDNVASVDITAQIAGESALSSNKHDLKYSFSLLDSYGLNRVSDLVVNVDGTDYPTTSTVIQNAPGALAGGLGAVDFNYTTNAGSNGATSLLSNGDARSILNGDSFAGNQNGGSDGSALAYASMTPVGVLLAPGDHAVTLSGTVKGNTASSASQPFSVTLHTNIITPGCGQN